MRVAMDVLRAIADALELDRDYFTINFRTQWPCCAAIIIPRVQIGQGRILGSRHIQIMDVSLLATDGVGGLEAQSRSGQWVSVVAEPGEFIINFGEMLQMWTDGAVRATPHRVRGSDQERISVPLFFNPNYDTNVAPLGSGTHPCR